MGRSKKSENQQIAGMGLADGENFVAGKAVACRVHAIILSAKGH